MTTGRAAELQAVLNRSVAAMTYFGETRGWQDQTLQAEALAPLTGTRLLDLLTAVQGMLPPYPMTPNGNMAFLTYEQVEAMRAALAAIMGKEGADA